MVVDQLHLLILKEWLCAEGVLWGPVADPGAQGVTPGWALSTPPVAVGPDSYGLIAVCGAGLTRSMAGLVGRAGLLHSWLQLLYVFPLAGLAPRAGCLAGAVVPAGEVGQ